MKLDSRNLFEDGKYEKQEDMPYLNPIDLVCQDSHLYGYILVPGKVYEAPHPCVVMFHGFPGYTTNNDLEHALRRMGFVVIHANHRGAWGSEGNYLFTNLIEDAARIVEWVQDESVVKEYQIDTDHIFIVGHSMGGMTAINTLRRIDHIKGVVAITPYDLAYGFRNQEEQSLKNMIELEGKCLRQEDPQSIFQNASQHYEELALENAYEYIKDKNILFIGAEYDTIAPPDQMIEPLWNKWNGSSSEGIQDYILLKTDHNLCGQRIALARIIGEWMEKLI